LSARSRSILAAIRTGQTDILRVSLEPLCRAVRTLEPLRPPARSLLVSGDEPAETQASLF
jgi:hypothetical protein